MFIVRKIPLILSGVSTVLFLSILFLASNVQATSKTSDDSIHHISATVCKTCHKETYKQWKGSMHANSTALKDPIHGTFYRKVIGDPKKEGLTMKNGKYPVCLQCHAPNAAKDKVTKLDAKPAYSEGVNCIACHTLKTFKGTQGENGKLKLGMQAYEYTDKIQGTGRNSSHKLSALTAAGDEFGFGGDDDQKPNPHLGLPVSMDGKEIPALPMESNPQQLRTSNACMGCHDQRNNAHGVPLCATGDEYIESSAKTDCLSCHMPVSNNRADHTMGGGHKLGMLQRSIVFYMDSKKSGDTIATVVTMENKQPHKMPTGAPFRNMHLKVTAYDASGNIVWENAKGHPGKTDKQAYMRMVLLDGEGKSTSPPKAKSAGDDNRLKPFEKRKLNYTIPAKDVVLVRSELYYNLLWPGLVKKFGNKIPKDVTAPKLIATSENSI
ncbi:MAG: cytochrome c family protein [Gammaproteobacteria bacterium]|nr:cytochrome c family protein [Gammaproteobacteria bacterium]